MRKFLLLSMALLAALLFYGSMAGAQGVNNSSNMTTAINSTLQYVNKVNQSSYLVFYPDLTTAYNYISLAKNESSFNSTYAYYLLAQARQSAASQEAKIYQYKQISLYVAIALAIVLAVILYLFMQPYKPLARSKKR